MGKTTYKEIDCCAICKYCRFDESAARAFHLQRFCDIRYTWVQVNGICDKYYSKYNQDKEGSE
jgi:hypothetical protein